MSLLSAIRSLRPTLSQNRGLQSYNCPKTTNDCRLIRMLGPFTHPWTTDASFALEELDAIHVATVLEVRYLNVATAMNKFGGAARLVR